MGFSIQYIDKDRGVSVRALLLDSLSREDMERECRKLVDEGHRGVQLLESRYTVSVVKRFDEIDDDLNKQLKAENVKLREAVATAIKVQAVLCGDADSLYCRNKCPLHRPESNDCLACDVIGVAQELGIEV